MVYGPGGYRFSDFTRLGAPLTLLVIGRTMVMFPPPGRSSDTAARFADAGFCVGCRPLDSVSRATEYGQWCPYEDLDVDP
jgi:hypothetical protein